MDLRKNCWNLVKALLVSFVSGFGIKLNLKARNVRNDKRENVLRAAHGSLRFTSEHLLIK
ncbi:CLUMA_CG007230, isoform A [Clunio marinus]|uniref:CLUMA_CG007230, isoform A n=1 Tax=Clunio marinus TaxID=568069 RepID=A0A1J1I4A6_9DIPT|nr:CLUMA_CG007230, isoform A [Clunio marinus]